jgi:hypothetical protein
MIPEAAREITARVLQELGYVRPVEIDGDLATGQFHFEKGQFHAIDAHWQITNVRMLADLLSYAELDESSVMIPVLGDDARTASPLHALALACVHRVAHHADSDALLWILDIHLIASRLSARERAEFVAFAQARRICAVCAKGIALAEAAFGSIDPEWRARLENAALDPEPSAAFLGGLRGIDILRADAAAMPRLRLRLALLRQHAFPSAGYMLRRYDTSLRIALPFLYLHRLLTGAPRLFRR